MSARHPIRFGFQTWQQNVTWRQLLALWQECEELGFDSGWNFDHLIPIFSDPAGPCLEAWTLLAGLAMHTSKLRIGTLVTGNTYRHPTVLAKMAVTVDHMSGGRLNFGLGASWFELEHWAYDIAFPKTTERLQMLDEALQVIKLLWSEAEPTYTGKYYQLRDAYFQPKALQQPHPPIMIGASGEKVALRVVAKHADIWNTFGSPELFRHKIGVLGEHCRRIGRNVEEIEKSVLIGLTLTDDRACAQRAIQSTATRWGVSPREAKSRLLVGSVQAIVEQVEAFIEVGVTHFILMLAPPFDSAALRTFASGVMSRFHC
ncbi:MAG: LLM class F420-dependent oxidoreductase [Candidatus Binatia bacterium]